LIGSELIKKGKRKLF